MHPVDTADRRAAGAGIPLVAGRGRVVEVRAAGALQQVAADGRLVAQLARGAGDQRLGEDRVAARTRASAAASEFAAWAPIRSPPSGSSSMSFKGSRLMSTRWVGCSISSFIRSSRLVPPLMNFAPALDTAATAARASVARS